MVKHCFLVQNKDDEMFRHEDCHFYSCGGVDKYCYCGTNNFGMQEGRRTSTTFSSTEDDLTLNVNSARE